MENYEKNKDKKVKGYDNKFLMNSKERQGHISDYGDMYESNGQIENDKYDKNNENQQKMNYYNDTGNQEYTSGNNSESFYYENDTYQQNKINTHTENTYIVNNKEKENSELSNEENYLKQLDNKQIKDEKEINLNKNSFTNYTPLHKKKKSIRKIKKDQQTSAIFSKNFINSSDSVSSKIRKKSKESDSSRIMKKKERKKKKSKSKSKSKSNEREESRETYRKNTRSQSILPSISNINKERKNSRETSVNTKKNKKKIKEINVYEMNGYIPISYENASMNIISDESIDKMKQRKKKKKKSKTTQNKNKNIYYTDNEIQQTEYDEEENMFIGNNKLLNGTMNFPFANKDQKNTPMEMYQLNNNLPPNETFQNNNENNHNTSINIKGKMVIPKNNQINTSVKQNVSYGYQYVNDVSNQNNMNGLMAVPKCSVSNTNANYGNYSNTYNNTVAVHNIPKFQTTAVQSSTVVAGTPVQMNVVHTSPQVFGINKIIQTPRCMAANTEMVKTKNIFYQFPNHSYPNHSYPNNFNPINNNPNCNQQFKTEIILSKNGINNNTNSNRNAQYNTNVIKTPYNKINMNINKNTVPNSGSQKMNNVFSRTRSLTPSPNTNENTKGKGNNFLKVSPFKNICIKTKQAMSSENNQIKPVCTHEITYTYPTQTRNTCTNKGTAINDTANTNFDCSDNHYTDSINKETIQDHETHKISKKKKKDKVGTKHKQKHTKKKESKERERKRETSENEEKIETAKKHNSDENVDKSYHINSENRFSNDSTHCMAKYCDSDSSGNLNLNDLSLNEKMKKIEHKNELLKKENENLNEMSRLYKNECNRLRELLVKNNGVNLNNFHLGSDEYDKVNLQLEEENEKLRSQLKALGKSILNSDDLNGVKKILAQQIVDLQEENEKCRNKIKALKKNNDVNHQVLFNLNKTDISADAMDSIFMQTKNVIIEGHESVNILYLNLKNLIDQLFEKLRSVINKDEYTKSEKLNYVAHLQEIIKENFDELNGIVLKMNQLRKDMRTMRAKVFDINRGNPYCGCKPARVILEEDIKHLEAELHKHSILLKNLRKTNLSLNLKNLSVQYTNQKEEEDETQQQESSINTEERRMKDKIYQNLLNDSSPFYSSKINVLSIEDENSTFKASKENTKIPSDTYNALVKTDPTVNNSSLTNIKTHGNEGTAKDHISLHYKLKHIEEQLNALNTKMNCNYNPDIPQKGNIIMNQSVKNVSRKNDYSSENDEKKRKEKKKKATTESYTTVNDVHSVNTSSSSTDSGYDSSVSFTSSSSDISTSSSESKSYKGFASKKKKSKNKEIEESKRKMNELLALLKAEDNEELIENTKYHVNAFGHKSTNNYNLKKIYENLDIIKNSVKNTEDDTEKNILAMIENQANQIRSLGNCVIDLKKTIATS